VFRSWGGELHLQWTDAGEALLEGAVRVKGPHSSVGCIIVFRENI